MFTIEDLYKVLSGQADEQLTDAVYREADRNEDLKKELMELQNELALIATTNTYDTKQVSMHLDKFEQELSYKNQFVKNNRKFRIQYAYAASIVLLAGIFSLLMYIGNRNDTPLSTTVVTTDYGQQSTVMLPDCTKVILNYGSRLEYNNYYGLKNRDIQFEGQALFEVKKNKSLPFQIDALGLKLKVIGTLFDVSAYNNDKTITVALYNGKVNLYSPDKATKYKLEPGKAIVYNRTQKNFSEGPTNLTTISAWKNGELLFEKSNMTEVLKKLERKYNLDIILLDNGILKSSFTATISNDDYNVILKQIEFACNVKCSVVLTPDSTTQAKVYIRSVR